MIQTSKLKDSIITKHLSDTVFVTNAFRNHYSKHLLIVALYFQVVFVLFKFPKKKKKIVCACKKKYNQLGKIIPYEKNIITYTDYHLKNKKIFSFTTIT